MVNPLGCFIGSLLLLLAGLTGLPTLAQEASSGSVTDFKASLDYRLAVDFNNNGFAAIANRSDTTELALQFADLHLIAKHNDNLSFKLKYDVKRKAFYWAYLESWVDSMRLRAGINLTHEGGYDNKRLDYLTLLSSPYTLETLPLGGVQCLAP